MLRRHRDGLINYTKHRITQASPSYGLQGGGLSSQHWGQDKVSNYDSGAGKTDVIRFADDIAVADIKATRVGN